MRPSKHRTVDQSGALVTATGRRARRSPRRRRLHRLGGTSAPFLALILAGFLFPGAAGVGVHPALGAGSSFTGSHSAKGCANASLAAPTWNGSTSTVHWAGATRAVVCTHNHTSPLVSSGQSVGTAYVQIPVRLSSSSHGVNLSLRVHAVTSVTVALPAGSACPTIQTTTHNNLGYTWENSTLDAQNCWALASVRLTAWTYVYDQTTGTAWGASNDWSGLSKDAGSIVDFTHILENYSNRSYWSENLSESSSSNFSYGPGARATVNLSPQLFINGTFRSTDRYLLEVGITMEVDAELFGFTSGSAFATWGSSQPGQFVQLRSTVW